MDGGCAGVYIHLPAHAFGPLAHPVWQPCSWSCMLLMNAENAQLSNRTGDSEESPETLDLLKCLEAVKYVGI